MNTTRYVVNLNKYSGKFKLFRRKRNFDLARFIKKIDNNNFYKLPG